MGRCNESFPRLNTTKPAAKGRKIRSLRHSLVVSQRIQFWSRCPDHGRRSKMKTACPDFGQTSPTKFVGMVIGVTNGKFRSLISLSAILRWVTGTESKFGFNIIPTRSKMYGLKVVRHGACYKHTRLTVLCRIGLMDKIVHYSKMSKTAF